MTEPLKGMPLLNPASFEAAKFNAPGADGAAEIEKAGKQFESLLLHQMMKSMSSGTSENSILGSKDEELYRDMFNQSLADSISEGEGIGIKEVITKELKKRE